MKECPVCGYGMRIKLIEDSDKFIEYWYCTNPTCRHAHPAIVEIKDGKLIRR